VTDWTSAPYRKVPLGGSLSADFRERPDGSVVVTSTEPLGEYAARLTDRLLHWSEVAPDRTLVARRVAGGDWRRVSFAEAARAARSIAQGLLDRGLSVERPVVVLSENDVDHLTIALGAMIAGVPYAPVSTAYSLVSQDFGKLKHIAGLLTPGLVYASSGAAYGRAIEAVFAPDVEVVLGSGAIDGRRTTPFAELVATEATAAVDAAHARVGPDTIAKFLFTSGSTKLPKGVINTQRMLCSNQQMIRQSFPQLLTEPPVLVDWLPWNHTFGGNHNTGIAIYNGGTLYIDDGKPVPQAIGETLRNLKEIAPTMYFNVPKGFEEIANALEHDAELRKSFFSRVRLFFFAGAGLAQPVWDKLERLAVQEVGERIRMLTGLGMTETAPFAICANAHQVRSGHIGLPSPGVEMKLVPVDGKMEVRYRGPNVTPGYWRADAQTAEAFDDEGFFMSGDAAKPMDEAHPEHGFAFDGRIAEDFKLATGTFVSVGPLRARVMAAGDPVVLDVVICGMNRNEVGLLIFPRLDACRAVAGLPPDASAEEVTAHPALRAFVQSLLDRLWAEGTGSATRPARAVVLAAPPSIDRGEITDKGSINQRVALQHRDSDVERLYAGVTDDVILPRRN
jgi:feruloyl-CoA synthase